MNRKQNRKVSPEKDNVPIYTVPEYTRLKYIKSRIRKNRSPPPKITKEERQRQVEEMTQTMIRAEENGTFNREDYYDTMPTSMLTEAYNKKNDYMIQKFRPKKLSPKRTKKGLPPVNDLAVAMAREIINNASTKTEFNLKKYLDRSSLPNKRDVHVAKQKAHQLVKKYFNNQSRMYGPKSKYQPPKYDPKDKWMHNTAYPGFYVDDMDLLRKIPPKNQNIMPKYWPKLVDNEDYQQNPDDYAQIWRQNSVYPYTFPEGWYPTMAKITENWSPGSGNAKILRPEFYASPDEYVTASSALRQMFEDYNYGQFDPNLPNSQQELGYDVAPRIYNECVRMFKIITRREQFEELPEQTVDNPLRSPSFDPKLDRVAQLGLKKKRTNWNSKNRIFARKMQRKLEDDMKKMERAELLELIRKEGDDPNYEFPENFFSDAGDWLHEELEARNQARGIREHQHGERLRPGMMFQGRRIAMRDGHLVALSDDDDDDDGENDEHMRDVDEDEDSYNDMMPDDDYY